jgi:hypothetical protein
MEAGVKNTPSDQSGRFTLSRTVTPWFLRDRPPCRSELVVAVPSIAGKRTCRRVDAPDAAGDAGCQEWHPWGAPPTAACFEAPGSYERHDGASAAETSARPEAAPYPAQLGSEYRRYNVRHVVRHLQ